MCLPDRATDLDPTGILSWLDRERISLVHTVPALATAWLSNRRSNISLQSLRWIFFAGEPLTDTLVNQWRKAFPQSGNIANLYGPTETTLVKCFYQVPADPLPGIQPAGWPQPDTQALVLTDEDQLCGMSEPGEIVIRTPFRTRGT